MFVEGRHRLGTIPTTNLSVGSPLLWRPHETNPVGLRPDLKADADSLRLLIQIPPPQNFFFPKTLFLNYFVYVYFNHHDLTWRFAGRDHDDDAFRARCSTLMAVKFFA